MAGRARFGVRRRVRTGLLAAAMVVGVLPGVAASAAPDVDAAPAGAAADELGIEVLSSPPQFVSGGDARLLVTLPAGVAAGDVTVTAGGEDVTAAFDETADGDLEGVVDEMPPGDTEVVATAPGGLSTALTLTNHAEGPMFSGPQQEPFGCTTEAHLGETGRDGGPLLTPADPNDDCEMDTLVSWLYRPEGTDDFAHYDPSAPPAEGDIATTTTIDGDEIPFIVRWERGTINRFVYSIAIPSPAPSAGDETQPADLSNWNERLIYHFQGGVGIGHYQGEPDDSRMLYDVGLSRGYAIAYSTGTKTGEHYNLVVGGETAMMVKDRFVSAYDDPRYTVGIGASGGGIQQYVYGQNHPGLIDAAIPVQSYPDMVTQTIHVGDCELLARWMDQRVITGAPDAAQWGQWSNRQVLQGLNAVDSGVENEFAAIMPWMPAEGASECRNAWRGLSALALNPHYGSAPGVDQGSVEWTHFADAINVYGVNPDDEYANRTWDNVGVQYGLQALRDGDITAEQFLDLNWNVGSWKNEPEMVPESCPYAGLGCDPADFDIWSQRNMNLAEGDQPAPRAEADPGAIDNVLESGMVFQGDIDIPIIDWRPYLEPWLDMHNAHQSFAARQRMLDHDGDASNQVIWFSMGPNAGKDHPQIIQAFRVMDEWMANIAADPGAGVAANAPAEAVDACFHANGHEIAHGDDVWSGILDDGAAGPCTRAFPLYSQSRIVAGAPITGDVFKCETQPIQDAIAKGLYGDWEPSAEDLATLEQVFPDGVCDYGEDLREPEEPEEPEEPQEPAGPTMLAPGLHRLSGGALELSDTSRVGTAVALSRTFFPDPVDEVIIATAATYPDALAAAPLGGVLGVPTLLVAPDHVPEVVVDELARLDPSRITILGGTDAIGHAVEVGLRELVEPGTVRRIDGATRYDTAAKLADAYAEVAPVTTVHLASGEGFADSLAGGPSAADGPVLLVGRDHLPDETRAALLRLRPSQLVAFGGTAAISDSVIDEVEDLTGVTVERRRGPTRYDTAAAIAATFDAPADMVFVATGENFPDGLAAGGIAAFLGVPILLVGQDAVPDSARVQLERLQPKAIGVLGGPVAVSDRVVEELQAYVVP